MKIKCDVCEEGEASVFCSADEAALCDSCDHRVHHANKLAGKHLRFSLLHPRSLKEAPVCDICQEKRAFLFCKEDRAILCRECDVHIHKANEHTRKHSRFLLTGVKLSATSSLYPCDSESERNEETAAFYDAAKTAYHGWGYPYNSDGSGMVSASSISEYLETLPGWLVDDLLDPSFANKVSYS